MTARHPRLLAYAQLLRLPNLFTAIADPLAGWLLIAGRGETGWQLPVLLAISACLYSAGMVLNDCFDYRTDCRERPHRPLPSGGVAPATAWWLGYGLLVAGLLLAATAGRVTFGIALFLALMVLFYNGLARRFVGLGPLTLGVCRFANFLLGMRALPPRLWIAPVVLAGYVVAVAWYAQHEVQRPGRPAIVKRLLLGIILLDAVMVGVGGYWLGAALVAALWVPAAMIGKRLEMT